MNADTVRDALGRAEPFDLQAMIRNRSPLLINLVETLGPRVIRNPSASRDVAASVFGLLISLQRQLQLYGIDVNLIFPPPPLLAEVETRCIEDAFDHCLASGSFQPFINLALTNSRQLAMFGIDETEFVSRVAKRMKDCANYELEVKLVTVTHTTYPVGARYTSTLQGTFRAKLRLEFLPDDLSALGLERAYLVTPAASGFELLPELECSGQERPRCILQPDTSLFGGPGDVVIEAGDFQVKYKKTEAELNSAARAQPIRFREYEPRGMDRNRLVVKLQAPIVYFDVYRGSGSFLRNDRETMALGERLGQSEEITGSVVTVF